MDDDVKSNTSYDMQVISTPVQLFRNLHYEESLHEQSMTSLIDSSTGLFWQHGNTDVSQVETIFSSFDLHIRTDSRTDESDGSVSPIFTSSPKVKKVLTCFHYVTYSDSLTICNKNFCKTGT